MYTEIKETTFHLNLQMHLYNCVCLYNILFVHKNDFIQMDSCGILSKRSAGYITFFLKSLLHHQQSFFYISKFLCCLKTYLWLPTSCFLTKAFALSHWNYLRG